MRQIFLDTETTGLSPITGDKIVEIGCVELINRKPTGNNWHHYINPERLSSPEAFAVHGIPDASLVDKPKFRDVAQDFVRYIDGAEVIIHNAAFDVGFLDAELLAAGCQPFKRLAAKVVCSLVMAKQQWPGKRNGLDALCDRLGVDNASRVLHGALLDAELLADVYLGMTRGQDSLAIEMHGSDASVAALTRVDLGLLNLAVVRADEAELAAHERVLGELDKASSGKTIWRLHEPAAAIESAESGTSAEPGAPAVA